MAQIVIDGVLFSPVLAHSLEPGDLIVTGYADMPTARIGATAHAVNHWGPSRLFDIPGGTLELGVNESVLRAVGARAGRGGSF